MAMYAQHFRGRKALPLVARAINIRPSLVAPAAASDRYGAARSSSGSSAGLGLGLGLALTLAAWDDRSTCDGEKIVWVDAHGKKVAVHQKERPHSPEEAGLPELSKPNRYFPYVILGYGVAGRAALAALLERDPLAKVLVVDAHADASLNDPNFPTDSGGGGGGGGIPSAWMSRGETAAASSAGAGVEFAVGARAIALNADLGQVILSSLRPPPLASTAAQLSENGVPRRNSTRDTLESAPNSTGESERVQAAAASPRKQEVVAFGRCLMALGSRPRPPPPGFIDPAARGHVTLLGSREGAGREELKREVAAGRAVTIVGSSWQALELACWIQEGRSGAAAAAAAADNGSGGGAGTCRMVFSDYAPLDHILPRYLSVALLRRLNRKHIKTVGHSSLRWVGSANQRAFTPPPPPPSELDPGPLAVDRGPADEVDGEVPAAGPGPVVLPRTLSATAASTHEEAAAKRVGSSSQQQQRRQRRQRRLQVMTAHSFDHLDTATHSTDTVVLAGVDVAPLDVTLDLHGTDRGGSGDRFGRKAAALEVDRRRGAVVVNAELAASSRVWVAGDAACFPSQAHGGRRLVIRSADHALHSGRLAGENMAVASGATRDGVGGNEGGRRYRHTPAFVGEAPLAGVRVAMLGECDASMPTHGFWWTNSATGLSRKTTVAHGGSSKQRDASNRRRTFTKRSTRGGAAASAGAAATGTQQRATDHPEDGHHEEEEEDEYGGVTLVSRSTARKEFTPVFGTGVVFYCRGSEVKGAMLWGFPGEATAAAAAAMGGPAAAPGVSVEGRVGERGGSPTPAADAAAGISARALDLLRMIMERSSNMEADLSDERVMQAWLQGLSDAARVVAQETGVGHLAPMRRSVAGRVTSSTRRPPGTRDELMYQNTSKTSSEQRRLRAAYAARIRGVSPADLPHYGASGAEAEFDPEMMGFLSYGDVDGGFFDAGGGEADSNP